MIVVGVDPHKQTHTASAVAAELGELKGELTVQARAQGHAKLIHWARALDSERVFALEDCRHVSGALERFLIARGERVVRVPPKLMGEAIAYQECGGVGGNMPNSDHNPANLSGDSCTGGVMVRSSPFITSGLPPAGGAALFEGRIHLVVVPGNVLFSPTAAPGPPPGPSASFLRDVRCGPGFPGGHPACGSANTAGPPDYTGFLSGNSTLRITDHNNGFPGFTTPGTVEDLVNAVITVRIECSPTAPNIGAYCTPAFADANALCACMAPFKFMNMELDQLVVTDGNIDANPFSMQDGPNRDTYRQGIFIP